MCACVGVGVCEGGVNVKREWIKNGPLSSPFWQNELTNVRGGDIYIHIEEGPYELICRKGGVRFP